MAQSQPQTTEKTALISKRCGKTARDSGRKKGSASPVNQADRSQLRNSYTDASAADDADSRTDGF